MSVIGKALLAEEAQARQLFATVWRLLLPMIQSGKRYWITVSEETRSLPQNAKFHAICTDLAKSRLPWAGKPRSAAEWKVLLVSAHAHATKIGAEMVPGLEGEFVNLRESTARMGVARASSLIEYSIAFCVGNDVPLSDGSDWIASGFEAAGVEA